MTQATAAVRDRLPFSALQVGVVAWLASELMFFAGLFAAYFGLRAINEPWPPDGVELATGRTAVFTAVLVASSWTMHVAVEAAAGHVGGHPRAPGHVGGHPRAPGRGAGRRAVRWTLVTVALGAVFLANQLAEYAALDFRLDTHAYGSMFFLMTGFHGLHVLGGLVLMLAVLGVGTGRTSRVALHEPLLVTEYYWHFVDVVWIGMFTTLYLIR